MSTAFLPLGVVLAAAVLASVTAGRIAPVWAIRLTGAALVLALATVEVTAAAVTFEYAAPGRVMAALHLDDWTEHVHEGVPVWLGWLAVAVLGWSGWHATRVVRSWWRHRGTGGDVLIVPSEEPVAFTETGRHGAVVITTALVAALSPAERRAVLAHERAHRRHRHDRLLVLAALAAAVPPLRLAASRLRLALERQADEEAASSVGDRTTVAVALARAALAGTGPAPVAGGVAMAAEQVPVRIEALATPPGAPSTAVAWIVATAAAVAVTAVAAVVQLHHLGALFVLWCLGG